MKYVTVALLLLLPLGAAAETLSKSPVPKPRPVAQAERQVVVVPVYHASDVRPRARPVRSRSAENREPRQLRLGEVGSVCRVPGIVGQRVEPIRGGMRGCGIADPVRVARVADVKLSRPALMDCRTARALYSWVEGSVKPSFSRLGGGVTRLEVAGHYACRRVNHRPRGDISEHGKGTAIDISGFTLANGRTVTVLSGWRQQPARDALRRVHRDACGPFTTVLGPQADRYHQDHFHFDTKARRSAYCR